MLALIIFTPLDNFVPKLIKMYLYPPFPFPKGNGDGVADVDVTGAGSGALMGSHLANLSSSVE